MSDVFLVTAGEYSSYHVEAAFSTQELADAYIAEVGPGDGRGVECFEVDVPSSDWYEATVFMAEDGGIASTGPDKGADMVYVRVCTYRAPQYVSFHDEMGWGVDGDCGGRGHNTGPTGRKLMQTIVGTKDPVQAVKVANERRAAILAAGAWGDNEKAMLVLFGATTGESKA